MYSKDQRRWRRIGQAAALLAVMSTGLLTSCGTPATSTTSAAAKSNQPVTVRIGYQKYGMLTLLKVRGTLEKRLASMGDSVTWTEFPSGPALLEGMNTGSIDFGTVGEAPPIFAQAGGTPLVYIGNDVGSPAAEAILVPKNSPLQSVADLKGKKVALNKGSNVHYLLVKALESAGLKYTDIQPTFLAPADARAAFSGGSVDAWVIWDPFMGAAEQANGARVLRDGSGLVANHQFYLASRSFATTHPEVDDVLMDELTQLDAWAKANLEDAAKVEAPAVGIDLPVMEQIFKRQVFGVTRTNDAVLSEQQHIADVFLQLALIPHPIDVKTARLQAAQ